MQPQVSIIIANYNGRDLLEKCLESLSNVNYKNLEIIIVDNNSTDDSVEFVTKNYPSIILVKLDKNKGFAEPNNIGAKIAKGQFLLFLNNDTVVTENFISEMKKYILIIFLFQFLNLKGDTTIVALDRVHHFFGNSGNLIYSTLSRWRAVAKIFAAHYLMGFKRNVQHESLYTHTPTPLYVFFIWIAYFFRLHKVKIELN